ncbi:G5 domain-containing protein [Aciduricibacillus chroicocephali]|uniref:G5 domain-containing protein n=1 Tax=Aciduricibacillus chroicocephali TaxID=3054939 RepID=A0ABY9KV54_9BACI|nr:G5 domain-containing protein [Bacillaceae bacterium 44XB]
MKLRKWMTGMALASLLTFTTVGHGVFASAAAGDPDGSTLGGIPIEGLDKEDAKALINEEIKTWMDGGTLKLKSKYETYEIPRNVFKFHVEASWNDFRDQTKRSWSTFFLKPDRTDVPLAVTVNKRSVDLPSRMDQEKTLDRAKEVASMLGEEGPSIVYMEKAETMLQPVSSINYKIPSGTNAAALVQLVENLNGKTIKPDSTFSLLKTVKLPAELKERTQELDFLATALFELSLSTDMTIAEHHSQNELPEYAKPGMEAGVNKEMNEDLILVNGDGRSYKIAGDVFGDTVEMSLQAIPMEESYVIQLENEQPITSRIVYRYNPSLPAGVEQTEEQGEDGKKVDVYRVHKAADGTMVDKKLVRRASYLPKPQIIMTSSQEEVTAPEQNLTSPDGTLIPGQTQTPGVTDPNSSDSTTGTTIPGSTTTLPGTDGTLGTPGMTTPGITAPGTTNPGVTTPNTSTPVSPGTGSSSTQNNNLPEVSNVPPQISQASPQMKQALIDSLRDDCVRVQGPNGKDRCKNESEIMSGWLLKFLTENGVVNNNQSAPITKSPELNGILKGMK